MTSAKMKKIFLALLSPAFVACAALSFMLLRPVTVSAETVGHGDHFGWMPMAEDAATLSADGSYYLNGDLTQNLTISSGNITLCLNGHTLTGAGNGSVITVSEGAEFTLCDCSAEGAGTVTGGDARYGGGVYVESGAAFTLESGMIAGNAATDNGGGVYVSENASFTMTGGAVADNASDDRGGGVYIDGEDAFFTMTSGTISNNTSNTNGGGVWVGTGASFTMENGTISENASQNQTGGGVYVVGEEASFTMENGTITRNRANSGGGVWIGTGASFLLENGTLSGNEAEHGGGVAVIDGGTFTMYDGTISDNTAASNGGGVNANNGSVTIAGGTISGNTASGDSDGMFMTSGNEFIMTGGTISDALAVNTAEGYEPPVINVGEGAALEGDAQTSYNEIIENIEAVEQTTHTCGTVEAVYTVLRAGGALSGGTAEEPAKYVLTGNVTLTQNLTISSGNVTLCLNGYKLTGAGDGSVITVEGGATFTLCDCNGSDGEHAYYVDSSDGRYVFYEEGDTVPEGAKTGTIEGGVITGGVTDLGGGGVCVAAGLTDETPTIFTMTGGAIAGNTASTGGGVLVNISQSGEAAFHMTGGAIAGNTANYGGGVYVGYGCSFTMEGGEIADNTAIQGGGVFIGSETDVTTSFTLLDGMIAGNEAEEDGGGVYVNILATFDMRGGSVTGNMAGNAGGGVYLNYGSYRQSTMNVSGSPVITGNTVNSAANNVYLPSGQIMNVTGTLTEGASIGITLESIAAGFMSGYSTYNEGDPGDFFKYDDADYVVEFGTDGTVAVVHTYYTVIYVNNGTEISSQKSDIDGDITLADATPSDGGEKGMLYGWTTVKGGSSIMYDSNTTIEGGIGTEHGQVIYLYAVAERDVDTIEFELQAAIDAVQDDLDSSVSALRAAISSNAGDIDDLEEALADLDAAYKAADALIRSEFAAADAELAESIAALDAACKAADSALQAAIDAVQDNFDKAVEELNASIAAGSADVADKLAELKAAYEAADALMASDITALKAQGEELSDSIDALESAYKAADEAIWDAIEQLESAINGRQDELSATDTAVIATFACVAGVLAIVCTVALVVAFKKRKM